MKLKGTTTSLSPMCLDISVRINPNLIRFDQIRKYDDRIFFGLTLYDILNSCEFNHKSFQTSEQYKTALPEGHLDARHLAIKWSTLGIKYWSRGYEYFCYYLIVWQFRNCSAITIVSADKHWSWQQVVVGWRVVALVMQINIRLQFVIFRPRVAEKIKNALNASKGDPLMST